MDERDQLPADEAVSDDTVEGSDTELDEIAADLDTVEAAMKAIDGDDMDAAERLTASLADADTDTGEG
jgi:hypothetical protein